LSTKLLELDKDHTSDYTQRLKLEACCEIIELIITFT